MHFLTPEQVADLAEAVAHPAPKPAGNGAAAHWRTDLPEFGLLVRLCAYTGLRAGEVVALRVGRLNLLRATLEVAESATEVNGRLVFGPTKNYQRRTVPLPRFLREDLAAHLQTRRRGAAELVFASPEGGPLRHNNFYGRHFKPAVRRAGLPESVRFHDLRHTYAGFLIAQGAHPRAIMERMGHSSVQVTLGTYGHLLPGIDEQLTSGLETLGREARERVREGASGFVGSRVGHAGVTAIPGKIKKSR